MSHVTISYGGTLRRREVCGAAAAWRRPEVGLTLATLALASFGLVMSVSAAGGAQFSAALSKRLALTGLGVCAFLVGAGMDYHFWRRHHLAVLALALVCLLAVLVPPLSAAKNGARRWIDLGLPIGFQPSEFAKIALCIYLAAYCERHVQHMGRFVEGFLAPLCGVGLVCGLVLVEPDFGTAALTGLVCMVVLLVMGTRVVYVLLAALAAMPMLQQLVFDVPYRMQRILAFLDPWKDAKGSGYQLIQSLIAVGSGGIAGRGLGAGVQKEAFLPGAANDFVFSVVAEELGLIGSVVLIALFAWLLWEALRVVLRSPDPFGFALGLGLAVLLGTQAATHIAVATACVPTKGLSLPFVSAGGSSLIASMFAAGLLVGIARFGGRPKPWQEGVPAYERLASRAFGRLRRACLDALNSRLRGLDDD